MRRLINQTSLSLFSSSLSLSRLCPPRSLSDYLRKLVGKKADEEDAKLIFHQLISTLDYLHSKNIAHCDLKFENILYEESTYELKLIDFGFSVEDPDKNPPSFLCGTPSYMSPEEVSKKNINFFKADIWSLGVILFKIVTGLFPFRGTSLLPSKNRGRTEQENSESRLHIPFNS